MLPQSASFKYLGLVFHESGSILPAFGKAGAEWQGCSSPFECQAQGAHVQQVISMMRRLFDAVVRPTVSYGCEVWAPACSLALGPELKDMLGVQMAFFRQLCHLRKSVTPDIIFREFAERPWLDTWWSFLLGFMRRLSVLPDDSLHLHILRDNIADAKDPLPCANWARGIQVKFAALGMASPFVSSGIGALGSHGFMDRLAGARQRTWDGLHVSPRAAPSKGAKLCNISSLVWPSRQGSLWTLL